MDGSIACHAPVLRVRRGPLH